MHLEIGVLESEFVKGISKYDVCQATLINEYFFTSTLTMIVEITMGSSCLGITPSKLELEKTIFDVGGNTSVGFFILPEDT